MERYHPDDADEGLPFGPDPLYPMSDHLAFEVATVFERGGPLRPSEPIPACWCTGCVISRALEAPLWTAHPLEVSS